jgi:hypothetical protein
MDFEDAGKVDYNIGSAGHLGGGCGQFQKTRELQAGITG